jgi:hypothetical protein
VPDTQNPDAESVVPEVADDERALVPVAPGSLTGSVSTVTLWIVSPGAAETQNMLPPARAEAK